MGRRLRHLLLLFALVVLSVSMPAGAKAPILHEPIPPDPREDVALNVSLEGELPAAIDTPSGLVTAPDPKRPIGQNELPYAPSARSEAVGDASFRPDRDTRRPDTLPYDDPFQPSTAPFKRLSAFDAVDASYTLFVRDTRTTPLSTHATPASDGSEEQFYADMVVDLSPTRRVRIPSVGPGARVMRARAGVQTQDVPIRFVKDGADNWFVDADVTARVRLVMEITIPRAVFGGEFGDPTWDQLPRVPALPRNVAHSAAQVAARIGLSKSLSPRDNVSKMVSYFRAFADSEEPPAQSRDIYLDLALSQKGVCRHRAFAFMVTAQAIGIPTRFVLNEAHAWVEVFDGTIWRRIDLGGAGRALRDQQPASVRHEPPPDPFSWPSGSTRGEDLGQRSRGPSGGGGGASGGGGAGGAGQPGAGGGRAGARSTARGTQGASTASTERDDRPASKVDLDVTDKDVKRGSALHVAGTVVAEGEPCASTMVDFYLLGAKDTSFEVPVGSLATDDKGAYAGAVTIPPSLPPGDYDVVARTPGDARCGRGGSAP
jgi:transglutaminase-like putative cysteine protease